MFEKKILLGVGITIAAKEEVLKYIIISLVKSAEKHYVVTPNPEILVMAHNSLDYKKCLNGAELALPDGIGVLLASKLMGKGLKERITGVDLMEDLKSEFDMIIFDAPPVLLFVDAVMLAKHAADGVVLVYKAGKIARGGLKRAGDQITNANAHMLGVVLNGVRASEMGPQYGYYSYDYKNYAKR